MSIRQLRTAVSFLTVIPVADGGRVADRLGRGYFPAVGALIGLLSGVAYVLVSSITTSLVGAVAAIAVGAVLTGGIHLDGLADTADGLFGARDVAARLAIMRDPRLGSFGITALVLVLIGQVAAVAGMSPARAIAALVIAGALSRWAMLGVVALIPYVRESGLGVAVRGAHRIFDLLLGSLLAAIACLLDWRTAVIAVVIVALTSLVIVAFARRRIGGATGDVYGAVSELCQLAVLVTFAAHR